MLTSNDKFLIADFLKNNQKLFNEWAERSYDEMGMDMDTLISASNASKELSEEAKELVLNEPCDLTIGQLKELINDIVFHNVSFKNENTINLDDVERLIERYGD